MIFTMSIPRNVVSMYLPYTSKNKYVNVTLIYQESYHIWKHSQVNSSRRMVIIAAKMCNYSGLNSGQKRQNKTTTNNNQKFHFADKIKLPAA